MVSKPVIQIRETTEQDAPFLKEWLMQPEVLKGFPMIDEREVDDAVRLWIEYAKKGGSITALYKKKPCGSANLYIQNIEKLKHQCLFVIVVDEKYRGQGVGTILMKRLEKRAKEKFGIELMHLEVYAENPAIRLYKRLGFVEYGNHTEYLKEPNGKRYDKILMQKSLVD